MAVGQNLDRGIATRRRVRVAAQRLPIQGTALGIVFAATLAVAFIQSAKPFYYDSLNYWGLGETFIRHGDFSLLNFSSPLRGYLLPLIDHGLQGLSVAFGWGSSTSAKIFNAIIFSFLGAVLVPRLATIAWPEQQWSIGRRIALATVLTVFWSGYLNFPLSDFAALLFVLLAFVAATRPDAPAWMLVAGTEVSSQDARLRSRPMS